MERPYWTLTVEDNPGTLYNPNYDTTKFSDKAEAVAWAVDIVSNTLYTVAVLAWERDGDGADDRYGPIIIHPQDLL